MADVYRFVAKAEGKPFSSNELAHGYSGAEINEISSTLQRLMQVRDVVLKVNQQYIASAAQADQYRSEPPFKLQGSYRNMNKMAEKISAVMNDAELLQLIADHYQGESQLLTTGAEENLLKLAELRGNQSPEQAERWAQIKRDFLRNKSMGGSDATSADGWLRSSTTLWKASVAWLANPAGTTGALGRVVGWIAPARPGCAGAERRGDGACAAGRAAGAGEPCRLPAGQFPAADQGDGPQDRRRPAHAQPHQRDIQPPRRTGPVAGRRAEAAGERST